MGFLPNRPSRCKWNKFADPSSSPHRYRERQTNMKVYKDILSFTGETPLIKLNKIPQSAGLVCDVYAKCEYFNPGFSLKDRTALRMIEEYEEDGKLEPGMAIIESSTGNVGISLSICAAVKGYRSIIVMPEWTLPEVISILNSLGAEVVLCPGDTDPESDKSMFGVTTKLLNEIPNSITLDQCANPGNSLAHYDTTAEELLDALDGQIDMIVCAVGTGGTTTGLARKMKEKNPETYIVCADPVGSNMAVPDYLNRTDANPKFLVECIGFSFLPTNLDRSVIDKWVKTNDKESFQLARRMIREEGLFCGASSGSAMQAALTAAKDLPEDKKVVVILPDGILYYIKTFVNDLWMEANHFQLSINFQHLWWWDMNLTSMTLQPPKTILPCYSCHRVLHELKKNDAHYMIISNENNNFMGIASKEKLVLNLILGKVQSEDPIQKSMVVRNIPKVVNSSNLGVLSRALQLEGYAVVYEKLYKDGYAEKAIGLVTAFDLLHFLANHPSILKFGAM